MNNLQEQVKRFPHDLEKAVQETETVTRAQIEMHYKYQIDLSNKEIEGERKLSQQTITTLHAKIKEQETFIKQLTQKADESTNQVQTIALKAIEGSSSMRFYGASHERATSTNI